MNFRSFLRGIHRAIRVGVGLRVRQTPRIEHRQKGFIVRDLDERKRWFRTASGVQAFLKKHGVVGKAVYDLRTREDKLATEWKPTS